MIRVVIRHDKLSDIRLIYQLITTSTGDSLVTRNFKNTKKTKKTKFVQQRSPPMAEEKR